MNSTLSHAGPRGGAARAMVRLSVLGAAILLFIGLFAYGALVVPTDVQLPGTQPAPTDNVPTINSSGNCGCHSFTGNPVPESVPVFGWKGGMMANAGRDPLFWSTLAIAEQDFLPGSGGVGDLCLHCHSVKGWVEGRSVPTNGAGLDPNTDGEGIMCEFCHLLTNPDEVNSIPSPPEGIYHEEQNGDFVAYDEETGPPGDSPGYYGGAQYVLNSGGTRLGPYVDNGAKHKAIPSDYFRDGRLCGTCHDVSNPAVGDLAHNFGSMTPLPAGRFSGTPGTPVTEKAAFQNPPAAYGIVERTFSEWVASGLDDLPVNSIGTLPADLQVAGGSLDRAYQAALWGTCRDSGDLCNDERNCDVGAGEPCLTTTADYEDGTIRYFTCQTCHMAATGGDGAQQGRPSRTIRADLPAHDQTGGSYWIQDAIQWQDAHGTLRFGTGLTADENTAMDAAQPRAEDHLRASASLSANRVGSDVIVRVTNLTGHKLITGYPEGRRMWLNLQWKNSGGSVIFENGAYGPIGNIVNDLAGDPWNVETILDPSSTKVYEAEPAMTQEWAVQLLGLGYDPGMVLEWDRDDNSPVMTLGDLAALPPGSDLHTFHFVLNNTMHLDNRIPPYGFDYDLALERNALPVPDNQYGDPGAGGTYDYWDEVLFAIPVGAASVDVKLYYQSTSWEYIQFLWLQNDGTDPFLGQEGINMLDAWLNTGMSAPFEMEATSLSLISPGSASGPAQPQMQVTAYDSSTDTITLSYGPACDATGHTIHYGSLADVSTYGWQASECTLGISGVDSFVPDPVVGQSIFWVIVGHNADFEGSYGTDGIDVERPPFTAAGVCFRDQSLTPVCE